MIHHCCIIQSLHTGKGEGLQIHLCICQILLCAFQIADHLICNEAVFCTVGQVPVDPKNKIVGCNGLTIAPYQVIL